eukprot:TRINITY_DN4814_c1_g2_i1.p1 TRINITY_DN4814_c1_g2~~TRINITY_DN4814_c1_g2_i1.p1  ORF type:complete len:936 (+),score=200.17 TRINITY_DN4814_c1_g2_i1:71-2809(+)
MAAKDDEPQVGGLKARIEHFSASMHGGTEKVFEKLSTAVVEFPVWTIGLCMVFMLVMAQGVWFYEEELSDTQFTPEGSQAIKDEEWVVQRFGDENRPVTTMLEGNQGTNMLTKESLLFMQEIHEWLLEQSHTIDGELVTYDTVCARYTPGDACKDPVSVLSYWQHNRTLLEADPNPLATINSISWRMLEPSGPPLSYYLGTDLVLSASGDLVSTRATRISYEFKNEKVEISGVGTDDPQSRYYEIAIAERAADRRGQDVETHDVGTFIITTAEAQVAADSAIDSDISNLILGYAFMLVFASFVLSRNRLKYSHMLMGLVSVFSTGISTFSAYGFCWYIGVKFNPIVQVLIMVLLGVGIDDTFVIMESWWDCAEIPSMKERMVTAMKHAGPAITITSITDLIAFLAGSSTVLPALRDFCYYASVGIAFDFAFQCTFVVAIAYLDSLRQEASRADVLCCVKVEDDTGVCVQTREEGWTESKRGVQNRVVGTYLPRFIIGTSVGKGFVLIASALFLAFGIYGCTQLKMNYNSEWSIPDSHAYANTLDVRDTNFAGTDLAANVYFGDIDYPNEQSVVLDAGTTLRGNRWVVSNSTSSWMEDFQAWVRRERPADWIDGSTVVPTRFYQLLRVFASTTTGPRSAWQHIDNIRWSGNGTDAVLTASKVSFLIVGDAQTDGENAVDAMDSLRGELDGTGFPWAFAFIFWETYKLIIEEITRNVAIAGSCVFVLVTIMIANIQLGLLVTLAIGCVDVCMLGFMPIIGVELNGISVICIVLAVGLSVDYSVHIAGAFLHVKCEEEDGRSQRAAFALWKMGPAVVNGGVSTFIAILPAGFAVSYGFKVFFRMFALIIFFGQWFGVLLLPVILSFVGPAPYLTAPELNANPRQNPLHPDHDLVQKVEKPTTEPDSSPCSADKYE